METFINEAMIKTGNDIAANLYDAQIIKTMDGMGGSKTWDQWFDEENLKNKDIIIKYANNEIDSVTAIYIAMRREFELIKHNNSPSPLRDVIKKAMAMTIEEYNELYEEVTS